MQFSFAGCMLDSDRLILTRNGEPVSVEPQVFDLLALFVRNAGRVIPKDELIEVVWQGRIVSDATISARINAARTAVGDDGQRQAVIRTLSRRGFELHVPVTRNDAAPVETAAATPSRPRIRYAKSADGTRIAFAVSGEGPPVMRTSHHLSHLELDWASDFWQPVFARMGATHTLIRYDVRGTGMSDAQLDGATMDDYVSDMAAVADAAGYDKFALVSQLQSVPVALAYIAANPGRVTRLVIHEGYVRGRSQRPGAALSPDQDPVIALMKNGWGDPNNGFMRAWVSMIIPDADRQKVTDLIGLLSGATDRDKVVPARQLIDRFDASPVLDAVKIPTLIIHSSGDTIHPVEEAQALARGIDGAELMILDSNNTLVIPSDPAWDEMMTATLDFLADA